MKSPSTGTLIFDGTFLQGCKIGPTRVGVSKIKLVLNDIFMTSGNTKLHLRYHLPSTLTITTKTIA